MEDHGKEVLIADFKTASMTVLRRSLKEVRRFIINGVALLRPYRWLAT